MDCIKPRIDSRLCH